MSIYVWEKVQINLTAQREYENPYTEVDVWADLTGPNGPTSKTQRVYGFWDGGQQYCVRMLAKQPGSYHWTTGSNCDDTGFNGNTGTFEAVEWSPAELDENPCRRGFPKPTPNGRALQYPDGTPFFLLGDTWWATPTFRFPLAEEDLPGELGPEMSLQDMVRYRKAQAFNCIAMIAAFPNWDNDAYPPRIYTDDGLPLRGAWGQAGTESAKDMHNAGGRPFHFHGRVPGFSDLYPDVDRINPTYFRELDRKIDYLNTQGFIPFIEVARRDCTKPWARYHEWPASYARFIQYVWSRYQANNVILSPIHYDAGADSLPATDFNAAANSVVAKGVPAFDSLRTSNASGSTLINYGQEGEWVTLHQIGNRRDHDSHWLLTQIYQESDPPRPALNGEPYYPGWPIGTSVEPSSPEADLYARSAMYGSLLSGGLAGHIYGAAGLWSGDIEPEARYKMWVALTWKSGAQMQYLRDFCLSEGTAYRDLAPHAEYLVPHQNGMPEGNRGWAYCASTPDKHLFLIYLEADCPATKLRGLLNGKRYRFTWYDPRTGDWLEPVELASGVLESIKLPPVPYPDQDWGAKLVLLD